MLKGTIEARMALRDFHLRIAVGKILQHHTKVYFTNMLRLPYIFKLLILWRVQLQELRNYLIAQQLKFLVLKGESSNEELSKIEMIELIKAAGMFLFEQHGPNSNAIERKL